MRTWVRRTAVLAASLAVAGGAVTSTTAAEVLACECPSGYVCFYAQHNGEGRIGIPPMPPSPACYDLPMSERNKIKSISNRSSYTIHLYDRVGCQVLLTSVRPGQRLNLDNAASGKVDSVRVGD
jgi:hypothetical protein